VRAATLRELCTVIAVFLAASFSSPMPFGMRDACLVTARTIDRPNSA